MQHPVTEDKARISEIFSSLQGEGIHLGEKHIFIRFEECHIHCTYCDELEKPGKWMTLDEVIEAVEALENSDGPHAFISLTGGEPLLYLPFLKPLMQKLRDRRKKIYLETNGILGKALNEVLSLCDCIAMDLKPSSVTGERKFLDEHREFLRIARGKNIFIKVIVSKTIDGAEFAELLDMVSQTAPETPVILVPLSSEVEGHEDPELMRILYQLLKTGAALLKDIRIVPRFHKILNIR